MSVVPEAVASIPCLGERVRVAQVEKGEVGRRWFQCRVPHSKPRGRQP